jgi:hypothetical protein
MHVLQSKTLSNIHQTQIDSIDFEITTHIFQVLNRPSEEVRNANDGVNSLGNHQRRYPGRLFL